MSWQTIASDIPTFGDDFLSFPYIQWVNNGKSLEPRAERGGFAMPDDQYELLGDFPADADSRGFNLKSGETLLVSFTHRLQAAVLATRFAWIKDETFVPTYVDGARSKLQALALVKGSGGTLMVTLTFSGMAGKSFNDALKAHRQRVAKLTRAAGQEAPASIFFATYYAGEPTLVGSDQKSLITPVHLVDDGSFSLEAGFVGQEALSTVDWELVKQWHDAWNGKSGPNGDGEVRDVEQHGDAPAPAPTGTPSAGEAPSAAQVRLLRAIMKGRGWADDVIEGTLAGITADEAAALKAELQS